MQDTSIDLFGLFILEPMTAFTDFIITVLCISVCFSLRKITDNCNSIKPWILFFLLMGVSTFLGGNAHAFFSYLDGTPYTILWLTMHLVSGLAIYFAQTATIVSELKSFAHKRFLTFLPLVQYIIFSVLTLWLQDFSTVKINTAIGMSLILLVNLNSYHKGSKANGYIAAGILVSFLTAAVHGTRFSFNAWFNYNDVSHVLIMISLYLMFFGVWMKTISNFPRSYRKFLLVFRTAIRFIF